MDRQPHIRNLKECDPWDGIRAFRELVNALTISLICWVIIRLTTLLGRPPVRAGGLEEKMKVIGENRTTRTKVASLTNEEWDTLQRAAGIPYDKRETTAEITLTPVSDACAALADMKNIRKDLGAVQKKWDALATKIDDALDK